jgi:hypothetical protein
MKKYLLAALILAMASRVICEELLAPKCFPNGRCVELSSLREPPDGNWDCWDSALGYYILEPSDTCKSSAFYSTTTFGSSQTTFVKSLSSVQIIDYKFDKIIINDIEYCNEICFRLKGDDIERCIETEFLYKFLKLINP